MKKICIFTNTLLSGGAEKQAVLLAKTLSEKYKVWVVVYYGDKIEQKYADVLAKTNATMVYLSGSHLEKIFQFFMFCRSNSIDIIFSYLLTTNLISALIGKIAGVKYSIGGIRNVKLARNKFYIQRFIHNYLNNKTIFNNYRGRQYLSKYCFNSQKSIVIPNCFVINKYLKKLQENDKIKIISVGRFHEQKDWLTAIKSVKELKEKMPGFIYYIIGYGDLVDQIRQWIIEYGIDEFTKVIINPDNLDDYYKSADIYLQTSIFEGLSNTVMESMYFELPLVVTNVGDNDRLVDNGKNGYLCKIKDFDEIAGRLLELIESKELRYQYGKESKRILRENYSFQKFQKNYFDFIDSLEK